tara:strand:+ start:415 stop:651 length:237 start_codon:yes stop_codon:yes gene_type:complete
MVESSNRPDTTTGAHNSTSQISFLIYETAYEYAVNASVHVSGSGGEQFRNVTRLFDFEAKQVILFDNASELGSYSFYP